MKNSRQLWRGLFFTLLITAFCGGLALPVVSSPVHAAPNMQIPSPVPPLSVLINEVAWGGTGIATAANPNDEWIELYNPGGSDIILDGWTLTDQGDITVILNGTIPSTQYFLLGRFSTIFNDVSINQTFVGTLDNNGETIYLLDPNGNQVDTANIQAGGSGWSAGTGSPTFASMERRGVIPDSATAWATYGGTTPVAHDRNGNPVQGTPGQPNWISTTTTTVTTITADTPDPSQINQDVNITVTVAGGSIMPTGTVAIAGANTNCTITLSNGTGSCVVRFTSAGAKTITATYSGDSVYSGSSDTESHQVSTPPTSTSTSTPTTGSATSVVISEFRTTGPNGSGDEFIEIYNPTINYIDISGWRINISDNTGIEATRATIPAATILRSGQYYLVAHNSYSNTNGVSADLKYGTEIPNDGGIALIRADNTISDEVGMHAGSAYQEGEVLSPLTGNSNQSYERKDGNLSDSCVDTNNNKSDFISASSGTLHNYSSQLSLCGTARTSPSTSTTTITADSPDPSSVNTYITVSVKVTGGSTIPSGKVNITGANTNCTINLNTAGTGSCSVKFTSIGRQTLTATYLGDNTHLSSTATESHQVTSVTGVRTPTRVPTLAPPPPLIGINEFVPRPGHDWNGDGVINVGDEYIELINHGVIDVNLNGYSLDDEANIGSPPYRLPSITLKPGERKVFFGSETGLLLSDGGDGVRLIKPNGQLVDAYNYTVVRFPDQSYCRLPDNGGLDDWNENCFPTPGLQNSQSASSVNPPTSGESENLCPIADTLPSDFVLAECLPFGNNIWNPEYWDKFGWFDEKNLPESSGKWDVFAD